MVQDADMGHHLAIRSSCWCPDLESQTTPGRLARSDRTAAVHAGCLGQGAAAQPTAERGPRHRREPSSSYGHAAEMAAAAAAAAAPSDRLRAGGWVLAGG